MKKCCSLLVLVICYFGLSACSGNQDTPDIKKSTDSINTQIIEESSSSEDILGQDSTITVLSEVQPLYFESDEVVNQYFTDYNAIAEIPIPSEEIKKGNIRTKALVYMDDFMLEVIKAPNFLFVSISSSKENENTTLYFVFRDSIQSMNPDITELDIQGAWDKIHESNYMIDGYNLNDVSVDYKPASDYRDVRINLEFPFN